MGRQFAQSVPFMAGVVATLFAGLSSQSVHGADLLEVYRLAQENDPTFEVARHGYEVAQEKLPQARAGNLPTVNLTGNRNYTNANLSFNGATPASQGIYAWTWNLQLTQPIMRPQNVLAYYESQDQVTAAQAEYALAEQDIILRVAQAYFDVLVAQETALAAAAELQAMQEQQALARRGYELGTMSVTDSQEARSKAEQARAQLFNTQNDIEIRQAELEKLTGKPVDTLAGLSAPAVTSLPEPSDIKLWIEQAKDNNPAVLALQASLRAAGYTVTKARAGNFWTLDFVASTGTNYSSGSVVIPGSYESRVQSNVAGIQFAMPIFEGGMTRSHIREALANRDKLAAQLEEARRKAGAEARTAYAAVVNGLSQAEALQAAVEAGESSVQGNRAGYQLGIRINSDVLSAQQQLFASRRDWVKSRYDTLLAGLKLKAAAGVLSEADVLAINGLLVR